MRGFSRNQISTVSNRGFFPIKAPGPYTLMTTAKTSFRKYAGVKNYSGHFPFKKVIF